ncbi:MAG: hypothetical protein HY332_20870 [Chloroflexi bacterium]|nr:hypothetical protein [Chloroflexota bacterium]
MDDEALRNEILSRFPLDTVEERLLRHDVLRSLEPNELAIWLVPINVDEQRIAGPDASAEDICRKVVFAFQGEHAAALRQLRRDLPKLLGPRPYDLTVWYGKQAGEQHVSNSLGLDKREAQPVDDEALRQRVVSYFLEGTVLHVVFERHGDRPSIGPGEVIVKIVPRGPEAYDDDPRSAPEDVAAGAVYGFAREQDAALQRLRAELPSLAPERVRNIVIQYGREVLGMAGSEPPPAERGQTPVMTRLNQVDLETLDTLIAAGLAPSRAEAVRWCLARIRERPVYQQLRHRLREIEELRTQL